MSLHLCFALPFEVYHMFQSFRNRHNLIDYIYLGITYLDLKTDILNNIGLNMNLDLLIMH